MESLPPKFCVLPFVSLSIGTNGLVRPCCEFPAKDAYGSLRDFSIEEIFSQGASEELRNKMLKGEGSPSCQYCYDLEKVGAKSKRQLNLEKYSFDIKNPKREMLYLDIRFSNFCNFTCRTCMPSASTSWYSDALFLSGGKFQDTKKIKPIEDDDELFEQLAPFIPTIEEVYFAGGEPLLEANHFRFLDLLIRQNRNPRLLYTTNLSSLDFKGTSVLEYWKKFEIVHVFVSMDDFGKRGEFIRKGLSYENFRKNLHILRTEAPHIQVSMAITVSLLNIYSIPEFLKHLTEELLFEPSHISIDFVFEPDIYSIRVLPEDHRKKVIKKYQEEKLSSEVMKKLNEILDYMGKEDLSHRWSSFLSYTKQLDRLRGEDFGLTMPEFLGDIKDV